MSKVPPRRRFFQLSLSDLFVLITLVGMAIGSLRGASGVWMAMVMGVTLLTFLVAVVEVAVDREARQAFAIGFAVCMAIYIYLVATAPLGFDTRARSSLRLSPELDLVDGRLPTTVLLRSLYEVVRTDSWIDSATGREIAGYDPNVMLSQGNTQGLIGSAVRRVLPRRDNFAAVGHCWWATVISYCGGWVARYIYLRRIRERET